jgi:hypothetical protein
VNKYLGHTGLAVMLLLCAAPMVHADITIFSDPFAGSGGDNITRGFYLTSYPGTNLSTVTLAYVTNVTGSYTTSLTARLGTYKRDDYWNHADSYQHPQYVR